MSDSERSRRHSRPSSRASSSDEFRTLVPRVAASVGLPPPKAPTKTVPGPPPATSESAKKRKEMAQSQTNATQPDPLPLSKRRKPAKNLLDQTYDQMETTADQKEWLLLALEQTKPKENYQEQELSVEELEDIYEDSLEDEEPESKLVQDRKSYVGVIVESQDRPLATQFLDGAQVRPRVSNSSSNLSLPNRSAAGPSRAGPSQSITASAGKPGPRPSKAQVDKIRTLDVSATPSTSKQKANSAIKPAAGQGLRIQSQHTSNFSARQPSCVSKPSPSTAPTTSASQPLASARPGADLDPMNCAQKSRPSKPSARPTSPIVVDAGCRDGEEGPNAGDGDGDNEPQPAEPKESKTPTKKQEAQLRKFGDAKPIVAMAVDMINARLAFVHPFPDLMPSEVMEVAHGSEDSDADMISPYARKLSIDWAEKYYRQAHRIHRQGRPPIPCEERYVTYMCYQLCQFRTQFKKVAVAKVPSAYHLIRGDPASVAKAELLVQGDSFLSPTQGNNIGRFKHDIFRDLITATLFDGPNSLGARYEELLEDGMPKSTIAFAACVIRRVIRSYIKNDKTSKTLAADADLAQYERYMGILGAMPGSNQAVRLENIQMRLLDDCLKATKGDDPVEPVDIPYEENDSEPDEELRRIMYAKRRRNRKKGKRREDAADSA
ncbi:hypothetical protein RhiJN_25253 [Ceratobasidium sp. AG-Ba]|nr:hypothetical protein RhiJN_25253 [Ceratobasidium sp. AG-Ba]